MVFGYEGRLFEVARQPLGGVAEVQAFEYNPDADPPHSWIKGAILAPDPANPGMVIEADDEPTQVLGIALQKVNSNPGFEVANESQVIYKTYIQNTCSTAVANRNTIFSGVLLDDDQAIILPTKEMVFSQFGAAKDDNGRWYLTQGGAVVEVVDVVLPRPIGSAIPGISHGGFLLFKFLPDVIAGPIEST